MLTSITIKDFRTFKDATIPLRPITVFIGPNNAGKTNAIRAIQLLTSTAGTAPSLRDGLIHRTDHAPYTLAAEGEFDGISLQVAMTEPSSADPFNYGAASVEVSGPRSWTSRFSGRKLEADGPDGTRLNFQNIPDFFHQVFQQATKSFPGLSKAVDYFRGVRTASLSVPVLRAASAIAKDPALGERGENFGAVLDWVSGKRPALFRSINEELRRVLKVDGCTTLVTDEGLKIPAIIEGDQSFGADLISDGVLLYMGLTTVAHLVGPNSLLIIEEPENGIHPRRLKDLLEQIRAIAKRGTQIILTTHSPILLDEFREEPESIVVFERDQSGTHVKQLGPDHLKEVLNGDIGLGALWFSGAIGGVPA